MNVVYLPHGFGERASALDGVRLLHTPAGDDVLQAIKLSRVFMIVDDGVPSLHASFVMRLTALHPTVLLQSMFQFIPLDVNMLSRCKKYSLGL